MEKATIRKYFYAALRSWLRPAWPAMRAILHRWFLLTRGITLGVRGAVIDGSGRVLLIRHSHGGGWQLPGGGVEIGETALDALARELEEEAGVVLGGAPPHLHGIFHGTLASRRDHVLVYVVREFEIVTGKAPDPEIAASGFFPLDALPDDVTPGTRARLDEIVSGRPSAPRW